MRIGEIQAMQGPNIYNHKSVLLMKLYLEELTEKESYEFPDFIDRLLSLLPGMHDHHCAMGRPGGFIERLYGGTYFGHIVEHVALELTGLAGVPAYYGKTLYADAPGHYDVVVEFTAEQATRHLLHTAVQLVNALVKGEPFPLEAFIDEAKQIAADTELGPSTRAIVDAASRRQIPWSRLNNGSLVQLGYGKHRKFIQATISHETKCIAVDIVSDKALTKSLLAQASIRVPIGRTVASESEAAEFLTSLNRPIVIKPQDANQGKGVSLNLAAAAEVRHAYQIARKYSSSVMAEEMLYGRNYRVLMINGKLTAASERLPAHVQGDGVHSIYELIEISNLDPRRGDDHEKPLTRIRVEPIMIRYLAKCGWSLNSIPAAGAIIYLRESANVSTGGTAKDVTDDVHPEVAALCRRVSRVIGLDICGIDLIAEDIAQPLTAQTYAVIEVNAAPGIRMHHYPSEGMSRDVGEAIVDMLYPPGTSARIPIISITGTNGKTTTTRMIAHILSGIGKTVGMTTTEGIYVGGECVARGDTTGPRSARTILCDPLVEVAVLETARGGIVRSGLGYDWSDIAIITNIQPDHIGQDGIEQMEDLLHIKSLLAERVIEGGTLILNADDERLAALADQSRIRKVKKQIVYFSLYVNHPLIKRHLAVGGTAYFVKNGWIIEATGSLERKVVQTSAVPITFGGTAAFHVANCMAAIAACRAYGLSIETIADAVLSFHSDCHNPGRTNLYRVGRGYVMVDYGHNPDSFSAVCQMASLWKGRRVTGVIGVPGDRDNSVVEQAGRVAARGFHRLIIKEDQDLRGRLRGEIANLLHRAAIAEVPERECILELNEPAALLRAIHEIEPDELIFVFYEKLEPILQVLQQCNAAPASSIDGLLPALKVAKV